MKLTSRPISQNVESNPTNWRAFMAEQMRNIPPIQNSSVVPPRMGGELGRMGDIDQVILDAIMRSGKPEQDYRFPMPDDEWYEPTPQHR